MDQSILSRAMSGCDVVIHLAAMLGVKRTECDKLRCLDINARGTQLVLEEAVKAGVKKIVFASSSEVYGEPVENPVNEDSITQGKTVYAVSKLMGEEYCKAYAQRYGMKYVILRYFNCYGPYQVAQFVVPKFILSVMNNTSPTVYGGGNQLRCYTYSEDTAFATVRAAIMDEANGHVFNIGRGDAPVSLIELAKLVAKIGGKEIPPLISSDFSLADRPSSREIFERYSIPNKAAAILKWQPTVSLEEGIAEIFRTGRIFRRWPDPHDTQA
jgi:UDP-glucose 4-epimerase